MCGGYSEHISCLSVCSVDNCVLREAYVSVGLDWFTFWGCMYGSHCSTPYRRIGSISCAYSLFMRVADAVLSRIDLRAKAAYVAFLVMIVLRSLWCQRGRDRDSMV